MIDQSSLNETLDEIQKFFAQPNAFSSMLLLILSILTAYWGRNNLRCFCRSNTRDTAS